MENIIWKPLIYQNVEYANYEINKFGEVRNSITKHELKKIERKSGRKTSLPYLCVYISIESNSKLVILHRAVAETFLDNKNNYRFVLFKDNNRFNVNSDNLYWYPFKENHDEEYISKKKSSRSKAVVKRRKNVKVRALSYKGNKCYICGYDRCIGALEFHHLDPSRKDFAISTNGNTRSLEKIKAELDKCICVCANCHREIHNSIIDLNDICSAKS